MSIVAFDPSGGMWLSDTEPSFIDVDALRQGRLARLRAWMKQSGYGAAVLFDPSGGMWLSDTEPSFIDVDALRQGRLARLRAWMKQSGYGAVVLFDPYNQRYATGSRNMFGYFLRNSTR